MHFHALWFSSLPKGLKVKDRKSRLVLSACPVSTIFVVLPTGPASPASDRPPQVSLYFPSHSDKLLSRVVVRMKKNAKPLHPGYKKLNFSKCFLQLYLIKTASHVSLCAITCWQVQCQFSNTERSAMKCCAEAMMHGLLRSHRWGRWWREGP